jgi:hypothetical protein
MCAVRFFIPSRFLALPLAFVAASGGISCQKKTEVATPVRAEKPPEREMIWGEEQPLGGVAALPAKPMLVKEGRLPLVYLMEQSQTVQVQDITNSDILAELPVAGRSIIRIDQRGGVAVGKETLYAGPLEADHKYGIYVIPDAQNTSRTGSYQPRRPRDATPAEMDQ